MLYLEFSFSSSYFNGQTESKILRLVSHQLATDLIAAPRVARPEAHVAGLAAGLGLLVGHVGQDGDTVEAESGDQPQVGYLAAVGI